MRLTGELSTLGKFKEFFEGRTLEKGAQARPSPPEAARTPALGLATRNNLLLFTVIGLGLSLCIHRICSSETRIVPALRPFPLCCINFNCMKVVRGCRVIL